MRELSFTRKSTLLIAVTLLISIYSIRNAINDGLFESWASTDFHSYWYSGHFIRNGINPYYAFENKLEPNPTYYIDGLMNDNGLIAQPGLMKVPANTAPMVLLLSGFSFFSWPSAKLMFLLTNLMIMAIIPFLLFRVLEADYKFNLSTKIIISFAFFGLFGTRVAIATGQTTLIVFLLLLLTLAYANDKWIVSGILLGFALSKYPLVLPVIILLIIKKHFKVVITSFIVQLFFLIIVSFFKGGGLTATISSYIHMSQLHLSQPGIHITSWLPFPNWSVYILISIILVVGLIVCVESQLLTNSVKNKYFRQNDFLLLNFLFLVNTLSYYHRIYDSVIIIFFLIIIFYQWPGFHLEQKHLKFLLSFSFGFFLIFLYLPDLPAKLIRYLPHSKYLGWFSFNNITGVLLFIALIYSIILMRQKEERMKLPHFVIDFWRRKPLTRE